MKGVRQVLINKISGPRCRLASPRPVTTTDNSCFNEGHLGAGPCAATLRTQSGVGPRPALGKPPAATGSRAGHPHGLASAPTATIQSFSDRQAPCSRPRVFWDRRPCGLHLWGGTPESPHAVLDDSVSPLPLPACSSPSWFWCALVGGRQRKTELQAPATCGGRGCG